MRNLKRVAWLCCFGGCCCAGLVLLAGERSAGLQRYCPYQFLGVFNNAYMFSAFDESSGCMFPKLVYLTDNRMHGLGDCGVCPDPIVTNAHPLPPELPEPSLVPQPDPRFSGILR